MIDDPNNRQIAWVGLTASGLTGGRTANANHPISGLRPNSIDSDLFGAAVENDLQVLVLEIWNPVGGDQWLDDLDDDHAQ